MFTEKYNKEYAYEYARAKKKVDELKHFYIHLVMYFVINIFISTMKIRRNILNGESFEEAFFDFGTFAVWFFWGIGLATLALRTFGPSLFLGKDWEERQTKKILESEQKREELLQVK